MAVVKINTFLYTGLSGDAKPTSGAAEATFIETDTLDEFIKPQTGGWIKIGNRGVGVGGGGSAPSKAEDAASVSGDAGSPVLAVRRDAAASGVDADGDYAFLSVDINGALRVTGGSGGGPATIADGADVAQGAVGDVVVAAGAAGTLSAKLRRLTTDIDAIKTSVAGATPAGANNIGSVNVATLPADPLGANADVIVAAGAAGSMSAKQRRMTQGLEDLKTSIVLAAGNNNIGDMDVASVPADPFGLNADAIVAAGATGSIQAKLRRLTQGVEDLKTLTVLAAGTNTIGKLASNSGVDIGDVDVLTLPAASNTTDKIAAYLATDAVMNGLTALTPKWAFANVAVSQTDSSIVAAVTSKKLRVLALVALCGATATTVVFNTKPAGAGSAKTPTFANGANGGIVLAGNPWGWFETAAGEGLTATTGAGSTTGILVLYVEV